MQIKTVATLLLSLLLLAGPAASAWADGLDDYVSAFTYEERKEMKIKPAELKKLYLEGKVQIIDIRFKEEQALWGINFATSIPLNELPARLSEIDKDKIIVTVCPHYDRASIARHYLTLRGYKAKYLVGGLLKLAEELRGDDARDFFNAMPGK